MTFATAEELAAQLERLLTGVGGPAGNAELQRLKKGAERWASVGWGPNWEKNALPLFR